MKKVESTAIKVKRAFGGSALPRSLPVVAVKRVAITKPKKKPRAVIVRHT